MRITITKADAIKGIEEAALVAGLWVAPRTETHRVWDLGREDCAYCAVGAVLAKRMAAASRDQSVAWTHLISYTASSNVGEHSDTAEELLRQKNWLGALSMTYEDCYWHTRSVEEARQAAIKFVEEHFPDEFEAEVPLRRFSTAWAPLARALNDQEGEEE